MTRPFSTAIRFTPAAQLQLAAERAKLPHQVLQDQPHAGRGPAKPFQEDAAEHDRELAPVHVVLAGRAVEHQRAEQHLDQQRIANDRAHDFAGRDAGVRFAQIVVVDDLVGEAIEVVGFVRETRRRLRRGACVELLSNRSRTSGKAISEPSCGAIAKSSQRIRSCRSSRASGPVFVPLGVTLVSACRPTS